MTIDHLRSFLDQAGDGMCPDPIFVIGSPRSGTTALARALGRHSRLWTSHESYVLNQLYGNDRAGRAWKRDAERQQAPSWLKTNQVGRQEFLGFLGAGLNALYTSRSEGRRWIEQTPLNTLMVDDLADMFPGAVFVHALRDGRAVVNSMSNFLRKFEGRPEAARYVPAWATDFTEACVTWRRWVEAAASFCERHPQRATTVVTDRLSADANAGFAALYRFLGLDWEAGPATSFTTTRVNSSFGRERGSGGGQVEDLPRWDDERRLTFVQEAGDLLVGQGLAERGELRAWLVGEPLVHG